MTGFEGSNSAYDIVPMDLACTCTCGVLGRVALTSSVASRSGYGLHHVEATGRPSGSGLDIRAVESRFMEKSLFGVD